MDPVWGRRRPRWGRTDIGWLKFEKLWFTTCILVLRNWKLGMLKVVPQVANVPPRVVLSPCAIV